MSRQTLVELTNMCMVCDNKGNILAQNRHGTTSGLILPDGHIEPHESAIDSMIREIKEETGLAISNLKFCGIKDWIMKDGSRYLVFLYKTSTYSGTLKSSHEGEVFWLPLEELRQKETLWNLREMLEIFCGDKSELFCDESAGGEVVVR